MRKLKEHMTHSTYERLSDSQTDSNFGRLLVLALLSTVRKLSCDCPFTTHPHPAQVLLVCVAEGEWFDLLVHRRHSQYRRVRPHARAITGCKLNKCDVTCIFPPPRPLTETSLFPSCSEGVRTMADPV